MKINSFSVVALTISMVLTGCAATKPNYQNKPNVVLNEKGIPNYYHVKSGDTVGGIAKKYGLSVRKVGLLNKLDKDYTIYANQWLKLWEGAQSQTAPETFVQKAPKYQPVQTITTSSRSFGYMYPTQNAIIKQFSDVGSNGIWFAGLVGDPVYASEAGTVIYSGNGLLEFGNLIMIRHTNDIITAYAHNNSLLVKEGSYVTRGQQIATMGNSGNTDRVALQFQVRKNGTAIDPRGIIAK